MKAFFDWLSAPGRVVKMLYALCGLSLGLEIVFRLVGHSYDHVHFGYEHWFGFNAGWGFLTFALLILGARGLGAVARRDEDFYDREDTASGQDTAAGQNDGVDHDDEDDEEAGDADAAH